MTLQEYFADKPRGSKVAMAKALGISKTWMGQIINFHKLPSAGMALEIERLTKGEVRRVDLRPDLFGEVK